MKYKKQDRKRPLEEGENLQFTIGCRHSNPDICKNCMTENKCAFVRSDNQCLLPPKSWKKLFEELSSGKG
jgi:hypothetical protein